MRNEEKLSLAIGEIDDSIIEEASAAYKRPIPVLKYATIAACTALVTVGILGATFIGVIAPKNDMNAGDMAPELNGSMGGSSDMESESPEFAYGDFGSVRIIYSSYDTITLYLNITAECLMPLDISLCSEDMSVIYTTKESSDSGIVFKPTITVNGTPAEMLPTATGEYEITVKFDNIGSIDTAWQKYISIDGFEPLYHGLIFN